MASRLGFCGLPTCGFVFAAGGRIAVVRVAREPVFESQRVNRFRQIRRELTIRLTSAGTLTTRPTSSVTTRDPTLRASSRPPNCRSAERPYAALVRSVAATVRINIRACNIRYNESSKARQQQKSLANRARLLATLFLAKSVSFVCSRVGFLTLGVLFVRRSSSSPVSAARAAFQENFRRAVRHSSKPANSLLRDRVGNVAPADYSGGTVADLNGLSPATPKPAEMSTQSLFRVIPDCQTCCWICSPNVLHTCGSFALLNRGAG